MLMEKQERPIEVEGVTREIRTGCGKLYVTVNSLNDKPFEVFANMGKAGGCASAQAEALGRMVSLILRCGGSVDRIVKQLIGINCHQPYGMGKAKVRSCADGIAQVLRPYLTGGLEIPDPAVGDDEGEGYEAPAVKGQVGGSVDHCGGCPECGSQIRYEEGCRKCTCGWSECG